MWHLSLNFSRNFLAIFRIFLPFFFFIFLVKRCKIDNKVTCKMYIYMFHRGRKETRQLHFCFVIKSVCGDDENKREVLLLTN